MATSIFLAVRAPSARNVSLPADPELQMLIARLGGHQAKEALGDD
ncbi:hypothetical protein [Sinorhizobium arboris]|nr:hypothetical protein [Sinorhizobium arboris]